MDALPLVLLGISSAVKQNLSTSTAELVYGTTLRLPGEFFKTTLEQTLTNPTDYASQLKSHMQTIRPKPPRLFKINSSVDSSLSTCTHVFIRCDAVRKPLQPPYNGPCRVIERKEKYFLVQLNGRKDTISFDRLKPAHLDDISITSEDTVNVDSSRVTRSNRRVHFLKPLSSFVP